VSIFLGESSIKSPCDNRTFARDRIRLGGMRYERFCIDLDTLSKVRSRDECFVHFIQRTRVRERPNVSLRRFLTRVHETEQGSQAVSGVYRQDAFIRLRLQ